MNIVNDYVLRSGNGQVDIELTVANFRSGLASFVSQHETEQASIADAVASVFDKHLGKNLTMPVLAGYSLTELNVQPENYTALNVRVVDYIRENSRGDSSLFTVTKGVNGGVRRRSDIPAK